MLPTTLQSGSMRYQRLCILPLAFASITALGCRGSEPAAPPQLSLEEIAAAWSGGRADPTCRPQGPRGEYLGPIPGAEHCQWPTVVRGKQFGTVTGNRDAIMGLGLITWERTVSDAAAVEALADSLAGVFTAWGLAEYPCPDGGRRWQRSRLGVQFTPVPPDASGRTRVMVSATSLPSSLPALTCPGAPTLPFELPRSELPTRAA